MITVVWFLLGVVLGVVLGWWLAQPTPVTGGVTTLTVPVDEVYRRAHTLAQLWEQKLGAGFGEAKRHQVLAQLQKEFPDTSTRQLARVIEAVA